MLHPSYGDLINKVNSTVEEGEAPLIQSRYSIVIASAKRARQIIGGKNPTITDNEGKKPLSLAVEELNCGTLKLSREGEAPEVEEVVEEAVEEVVEEADENVFEDDLFSGADAFKNAFASLKDAVDNLDFDDLDDDSEFEDEE